jgi:lysozyme family protein
MVEEINRFQKAVSVVLDHEGLFTNNPSDPGGATNYGISLRFLKNYGIDINDDGQINLKDIEELKPSQAQEIFKKYWWDKYNYDAINSLYLATKIFDMAVNMGAQQAHKLVQEALSYCGHKLEVDGVLGSKTLAAINEVILHNREDDLKYEIQEEQKWFYEHLADDKPALKVFLKGWLKRASW